MANTFIQGNATTVAQSAATYTLAYSGSVTLGNLLVVSAQSGPTGQTITSITDNMGVGNVWTIATDPSLNGINAGWGYTFTKGSGACTVSVNLAATAPNGVLEVGEWHGPNAVRAIATAASGVSSSAQSNSITAVAGDLMISVFGVGTGTTSATGTGSYTVRETGTVSGTIFNGIMDNLSASAGSQQSSVTFSASQTVFAGLGAFFFNTGAISSGGGSATVWMPNPLTNSVNF